MEAEMHMRSMEVPTCENEFVVIGDISRELVNVAKTFTISRRGL
jgi:hypothetical protein